jgi:glutathione S-transferase
VLDVNVSLLASTLAGWRGTAAFRPAERQPERPLELYEFEACPFCRLVREALTEMDLDALVRPCPKGGTRFRPEAERLGDKQRFPFLVDPNTGKQLHESADIVEYLAQTYGARARGTRGLGRTLRLASAQAASALRVTRGLRSRPSRAPARPLELYSFESSPFSRLVREVLCELELPYLLRSTGKALWQDMGPPWVHARLFEGTPVEGRNRKRLHALTGRVQVPYLIDPNGETGMFESAAIVAYLERTYASSTD